MTATEPLSRPLALARGAAVPNRLLKSAMSEALGDADGAPRAELITLYRRWAEGGIGLSVTGNVMIDRAAIGEPGNVIVEDERHLGRLIDWARAGRANGTRLWMQINHPGKQAPRGLNRETVSPSAVPFRPEMAAMFATPRALRCDEIEDLIARFATTARVARKAGFDGVQIHGAHGYLVSQFLSPHHNRRNDAWGGDAERRRRFLLQIIAAMRAECGKDFPIGIKMNSADFQRGGVDEAEALDTVAAISEAGIDLIEISGGTYEAPAMTGIRQKRSTREREAYFLQFAEQARAVTKVPLVVTGGFRTPAVMAAAIDSGAIDMVGLARALALEPDLPARLLAGLTPRHEVRPVRTRIPMIDRMGIMEVVWYTRQLHRIGSGQPPRPRDPALRAFLAYAARNALAGARPQRLRATG